MDGSAQSLAGPDAFNDPSGSGVLTAALSGGFSHTIELYTNANLNAPLLSNWSGMENGNFRFSIADVGGAAPEPESWALMIAGFGLVGAALRRRHASVADTS